MWFWLNSIEKWTHLINPLITFISSSLSPSLFTPVCSSCSTKQLESTPTSIPTSQLPLRLASLNHHEPSSTDSRSWNSNLSLSASSRPWHRQCQTDSITSCHRLSWTWYQDAQATYRWNQYSNLLWSMSNLIIVAFRGSFCFCSFCFRSSYLSAFLYPQNRSKRPPLRLLPRRHRDHLPQPLLYPPEVSQAGVVSLRPAHRWAQAMRRFSDTLYRSHVQASVHQSPMVKLRNGKVQLMWIVRMKTRAMERPKRSLSRPPRSHALHVLMPMVPLPPRESTRRWIARLHSLMLLVSPR